MTDDLYEEVETGSFEKFKHGATPTVRVDGFGSGNGQKTSSKVALSIREVDGAGSSLEWVGLKHNEFFKFRIINKALGFTPAEMREAASACAPIPTKDDPPTAPVPLECVEAWVAMWGADGRSAVVQTFFRNKGDDYLQINWEYSWRGDHRDYDPANGPDEIPI